ncbi:MAG: IclR family transcriptional regulator [Firmicutes bacterium]|nr:IclR family transcriptional regulator [Bacillota bacterium]
MGAKQKATLQTVDRALELLNIMASNGEKMSVMDISKVLGITRTGAYTLLNSLLAQHFVEKDPSTNKYYIGFRFLELGSLYRYQYPFVLAAERGIYALSRRWKHQINLTIYKPICIALLLLTKASEEVPRATRVVLPAYVTAGGKLLLSQLPEKELLEAIEKTELRKFARNTITDKDKLLQNIEEIRKQGYSVEREETNHQKGCIAGPIRDMSGEVVAAISMSMPVTDLDENFDQYLGDLLGTCSDISMKLGYNPFS